MAPANWLPSRSPYRVTALIRCLMPGRDAIRLPSRTSLPTVEGFSGTGPPPVGVGAGVVAMGPPGRVVGGAASRQHVSGVFPPRAGPTRSAGDQPDLLVHRRDRGVGDQPGPLGTGGQHPVQLGGV